MTESNIKFNEMKLRGNLKPGSGEDTASEENPPYIFTSLFVDGEEVKENWVIDAGELARSCGGNGEYSIYADLKTGQTQHQKCPPRFSTPSITTAFWRKCA